MSIKVEIVGQAETRTVTGNKSGKQFSFTEQAAYAFLPGKKFPKECRIKLQEGASAWPLGYYTLADESFDIGDFGDIKVIRHVLTPIQKAV